MTKNTDISRRTSLAATGANKVLIAETGGLNAMVVDSTALPEQVVDAVVQSAFRSAGQRCSALRLLAVHEGIADGVIEMIKGALAELRVGDPSKLETDVGPLIDAEAYNGIRTQVERLKRQLPPIKSGIRASWIKFQGCKALGQVKRCPFGCQIGVVIDITFVARSRIDIGVGTKPLMHLSTQ